MGVAVAIVLGVALPHLRQGSKILSDEGEQRVRDLRRRVTTTADSRADTAADGPAGRPADSGPDATVDSPAGGAAGPAGYGRVTPDVAAGSPVPPPPAPRGAAVRDRWTVVAGAVTDAMTRAREGFDGAARRAGEAADRVDVAGTPFGDQAEQVGEKVRRGMTGALRWLGTRPERVAAALDSSATATAPHGLPRLPADLAPDAPRTPEVGIPAELQGAAMDGDDVIDLRDRPIGLTIDLRDLPQMPPLERPVPVRVPAVREDGASATDRPDDDPVDGLDDLDGLDRLDHFDEFDDEFHVGPRHAR